MKLKVTYTGGLDSKLDKKICSFFEGLGFEWRGQGMETETQIRDIAFEKPKKEVK